MSIKKTFIFTLWLLLIAGSALRARGDDFDPSNPPEPNEIVKCNITVSASPLDKVYTSGSGRYVEGTVITISSSSAEANWKFKQWLKDGEVDVSLTSSSFKFTVGKVNVAFTAVYEYEEPSEPDEPDVPEFNPDSPAEPEYSEPEEPEEPPVVIEDPKYSLNLVHNPRLAGAFNIDSGNKYKADAVILLQAIGNQNFEFQGWYDENMVLLSSSLSFSYKMPACDTTLTARWIYNPGSPDDPLTNDQQDIDNSIVGDVNADNLVDAVDIQRILNIISKNFVPATGDHSGDVNKDGSVNAVDLQRVLNIIADK